MAGDLTQRVYFLRRKGILGKRETPRDRGWSTSETFEIARQQGYEGGFQGQGISSRSGRTAQQETEVQKDTSGTVKVYKVRETSQKIKTQSEKPTEKKAIFKPAEPDKRYVPIEQVKNFSTKLRTEGGTTRRETSFKVETKTGTYEIEQSSPVNYGKRKERERKQNLIVYYVKTVGRKAYVPVKGIAKFGYRGLEQSTGIRPNEILSPIPQVSEYIEKNFLEPKRAEEFKPTRNLRRTPGFVVRQALDPDIQAAGVIAALYAGSELSPTISTIVQRGVVPAAAGIAGEEFRRKPSVETAADLTIALSPVIVQGAIQGKNYLSARAANIKIQQSIQKQGVIIYEQGKLPAVIDNSPSVVLRGRPLRGAALFSEEISVGEISSTKAFLLIGKGQVQNLPAEPPVYDFVEFKLRGTKTTQPGPKQTQTVRNLENLPTENKAVSPRKVNIESGEYKGLGVLSKQEFESFIKTGSFEYVEQTQPFAAGTRTVNDLGEAIGIRAERVVIGESSTKTGKTVIQAQGPISFKKGGIVPVNEPGTTYRTQQGPIAWIESENVPKIDTIKLLGSSKSPTKTELPTQTPELFILESAAPKPFKFTPAKGTPSAGFIFDLKQKTVSFYNDKDIAAKGPTTNIQQGIETQKGVGNQMFIFKKRFQPKQTQVSAKETKGSSLRNQARAEKIILEQVAGATQNKGPNVFNEARAGTGRKTQRSSQAKAQTQIPRGATILNFGSSKAQDQAKANLRKPAFDSRFAKQQKGIQESIKLSEKINLRRGIRLNRSQLQRIQPSTGGFSFNDFIEDETKKKRFQPKQTQVSAKETKKTGKQRKRTEYQPSLYATAFNIRSSKKRGTLTGLEIRTL